MIKVLLRKIHTLFVLIIWVKLKLGYSNLLFYVNGSPKENDGIIRQLKNIHKSQRIFVICNGPSLRYEDLDKLADNNEISIGCNKISPIFNYTKWRPTYYTLMDPAMKPELFEYMDAVPAKFKLFKRSSFLFTKKVGGRKLYLSAKDSRKYLERPRFSMDLSTGIYTIGTVAYSMLQMAAYFGANEIYILGCDLSYNKKLDKEGNKVSSYFKGTDPKYMNDTASVWEMDKALEFAAKFAKENGIQIFNATRGGYLESFPRVDFDSLFV